MTPPDPTPLREALALTSREAPCTLPTGSCTRFEFTSRGDRVPATLVIPSSGGRAPLVMLLPGDPRKAASQFPAEAEAWIAAGAAICSLDLPLHGERASAKLTKRLIGGLERPAHSPDDVWLVLWSAFAQQAVADLGNALDAIAELAIADSKRIVCVGTGLGATLSAAFCASDPRPRAAALARGSAIPSESESEAFAPLAKMAPRPLLIVGDDPAAAALEQAAGPTAERANCLGAEPGGSLRAMTPFVLNQLGLSAAPGG